MALIVGQAEESIKIYNSVKSQRVILEESEVE
jgi:hypothetical protein